MASHPLKNRGAYVNKRFSSRYGFQIWAYLLLRLYLDRGQEGSRGSGSERSFQIGTRRSAHVVLTIQHSNLKGFSTNKLVNSIRRSVHQALPSAGQYGMLSIIACAISGGTTSSSFRLIILVTKRTRLKAVQRPRMKVAQTRDLHFQLLGHTTLHTPPTSAPP